MEGKTEKFKTKKSLGQHFLNNTHIPAVMADAGDVVAGDVVVEIGPGTGVLTKELLARGATVIALEADQRAIATLGIHFAEEITAQKLVISHTDVRNFDLHALGLRPRAYKVVANIPYYLSGMLFRLFLEHECHPSTLVFLVQREVGERIARDKKESILSLSVKVFGSPKYVKTVGKGNFTPPPKIDSAIIAVTDISHRRFETHKVTKEQFFALLHAGFGAKRKQLIGNLAHLIPRLQLRQIFSACGIEETARGEDVTLEKWLLLAAYISPQFVHTE